MQIIYSFIYLYKKILSQQFGGNSPATEDCEQRQLIFYLFSVKEAGKNVWAYARALAVCLTDAEN